MKITLEGRTNKGRNRIREFGRIWEIKYMRDNLPMDTDKKAVWAFITPYGNSHPNASRWIKRFNDPDFEIIEFS